MEITSMANVPGLVSSRLFGKVLQVGI